MVGRTNAGTGKLNAIIGVTYPAGGTCTCTNGTKTYTARSSENSAGMALFNVAVGEWTASCTDGDKSASKAISITVTGQCENVNLSYDKKIFTSGTGYEDGITTTIIYGNGLTVTDDNIAATDGKWFIDPMDMTEYSTLKIELERLNRYDTYIAVRASKDSSSIVYTDLTGALDRQIISLDISSVSGSYGILFSPCYSTTIYNIYLSN